LTSTLPQDHSTNKDTIMAAKKKPKKKKMDKKM